MARVRQLERNALRTGVSQAFEIAHSHYTDNIDLETMSLGFAPGYESHEMDEIETVVAPLSWDLVDRIEDSSPPEGLVSQVGWMIIIVIKGQALTLMCRKNKFVISFHLIELVFLPFCMQKGAHVFRPFCSLRS